MSEISQEIDLELRERVKKSTLEPADVLREMMLFYYLQAKDILETIIASIEDCEEGGKPKQRGDLLALMYKKHSEAADKAIECATKLAPYKHSKLESVEVKKEVTQRFVIRAPVQLPTTEEWLNQIPKQEPKLIEVNPQTKPQIIEEFVEEEEDYEDIY